jgi:hypothetical protein
MGKPKVYFVDGVAIERDYLCLIAWLHELDVEDEEGSRIYFLDNKKWGHYESGYHLVSVAYLQISGVRTYFFLGKRGNVVIIDKNRQREELIKGPGTGAGRLGYLSQIRAIDGELYACGANRQVYTRRGSGWVPIHDQIMDKPDDGIKYGFHSIDGTSSKNIYAAGRKGEIYHYNGKTWSPIDSPTNAHLERVLCIDDDLTYICGNDGTVIRGKGKTWRVLSNEGMEENFWGLAEYKGEIYVSYTGGLMKVDGDSLQPVKSILKKEPGAPRLSAVDDVLWCFGGHYVIRFDGKKWESFECPDNL